jgi:hypothetical protein
MIQSNWKRGKEKRNWNWNVPSRQWSKGKVIKSRWACAGIWSIRDGVNWFTVEFPILHQYILLIQLMISHICFFQSDHFFVNLEFSFLAFVNPLIWMLIMTFQFFISIDFTEIKHSLLSRSREFATFSVHSSIICPEIPTPNISIP